MNEAKYLEPTYNCVICGTGVQKQEGQNDPSKYVCIGCLKGRLEYLERTSKIRQQMNRKQWKKEKKDIEILKEKLKGFL